MNTNEQKFSYVKIPDMTLTLRAVSIEDAVKILQFIGETLGIEYSEVDDKKKEDGTHSVEIRGDYIEGGNSNEEVE